MSEFNLNDYISVNTRIEKFWEKYPAGRIETTILSITNGVITMKANVYRDILDVNPAATGHAYEKEGASFINKTSALENCETSVVGRALAILGFEVKAGIASKEEVANAIHQQEQKTKPDKIKATVDPDLQLKKDLVAQFKGDNALAKAEYERILKVRNTPKAEPVDETEAELEADMEEYLQDKLGAENVNL